MAAKHCPKSNQRSFGGGPVGAGYFEALQLVAPLVKSHRP